MTFIKNRRQLVSHGNADLRRTAVDIFEAALAGADPAAAVRRMMSCDGDRLAIGPQRFDLNRAGRIFVIGAGKASFPIAETLETLLGDRISGGVVVVKHGQPGTLRRCRMVHAAHPIPDEAGLTAAEEALALARQTRAGDIVLGCITGGSSALLPLPVPGVSLKEKQAVNRLLLTCGANIIEINAVRKHLSRIKGGRLAAALHENAVLINLTVSDVIGDPLDYITDPTVPDTSSVDDARTTLTRYRLWEKVPASVRGYLKNAGPEAETPKDADLAGRRRHDFIVVAGDAAVAAAAERAAALGFSTMILTTMLEGESRETGRTFAAIANEINYRQRPLTPPCAVIAGGETTVAIDGEAAGSGGPNQEFALAAACHLAPDRPALIAGLDTDGTDGPTDLAGAVADEQSAARARALGIDIHACLGGHDTAPALRQLEDAVITGATGTNVNDLKLLLVPGPEPHGA